MTIEAIPLAVVSGVVPARADARTSMVDCAGRPAAGGADVAARIADHPCYSADAHQYYARMHLPVAPGCNIQCNYCNRKFDCSNESRPGVTSALLTPQQALASVRRVANGVKQLRVVGVAGPGEPLANASRTFRTLELVREHCPDLRLCLSTNGLRLTDHVDRIADLGIEHVTITINAIDPDIGARIYPWITYRGRRYTGTEAARILVERQLAGLAALTGRSILCKVNSVAIPGINDDHLVEVTRTVRSLGALIHNVMPLLASPEHGTYFGLTGQRGPTERELQTLRQRCEETAGESMAVMRHCRQCRADAVGMLGEDRSADLDAIAPDATTPDATTPDATAPDATTPSATAPDAAGVAGRVAVDTGYDGAGRVEVDTGYDLAGRAETRAAIERWRADVAAARVTSGIATGAACGPGAGAGCGAGGARPADTVLVAVATTGGGVVNQHFGRATEFWIYEAARGWARLVGIRKVPTTCGGAANCGEQVAPLASVAELLGDCAAVLCSKIGPMPHGAMTAAGIEPVEVHDLIEQAVAREGARLVGERVSPT